MACLSLFVVATAIAQGVQHKPATDGQSTPAATPIPTVDQILDKYVQAVGGKAEIEKLTTRIMTGSLVTPGGSATLEVYEKAPNRFLVIIDSPASGISKNGFNGAVAWSQNSQRGLREMSGPEVENFKREYDLHREIRLREFYPKMSLKGREKIGSREAYVVEATTADGLAEVMYFDAGTGLLARRDVTLQGTTLQTHLEDYKQADGVKLPFTIRRARADFSFTYKFDEVKHGIVIQDSKFDKPATQ